MSSVKTAYNSYGMTNAKRRSHVRHNVYHTLEICYTLAKECCKQHTGRTSTRRSRSSIHTADRRAQQGISLADIDDEFDEFPRPFSLTRSLYGFVGAQAVMKASQQVVVGYMSAGH